MSVIRQTPPTIFKPTIFTLTAFTFSWLAASAGGTLASVDGVTSAHPAKSVKQCNQELEKNAAALEAAGESASAFFHRCWWHSEQGQPTPIAHGDTVPPAGDKGAAERNVSAEEAPPARRAAARGRSSRRRPPREPRQAAAPRRRSSIEADVPEIDTAPQAVVAVPVPAAPRALTQVNVNVPVVGTVAVPVLPGLETTVRAVVEHPVVPGLVTMSP